ncbi:MAG: class I SAM-dependent methyltransferase [Lachnospiraceae bacterium]|nr:class I SAM-dependent methyltransferase [Lachnospiraceae bacterium]
MSTRKEIVSGFYGQYDEDGRTTRSRHGQLEYRTTMSFIHRYAVRRSKILEVGAGTGRYSIALAKEGMDVTAVELVESNLEVLRENSKGLTNLNSFQGDATDLSLFPDDSFDVTLLLGPMYHLYEPCEVNCAIDEAIRVTKPNGVILFAFISVFAIMYANYFYGNWAEGQAENFTKDYQVRHFKEQLFTGYDVTEFEALFHEKTVEWITTAGVDGLMEPIEKRPDFSMTDEEFDALSEWYLAFSEKRELLGNTNHLLYICRKHVHSKNIKKVDLFLQ